MGLGMSAGPLHDPPIRKDASGHLVYDSSSEPEAAGYQGIQPEAVLGGARMAEAQARGTSQPLYAQVVGDHDDLLAGAPKTGDQPE